MKLTKRMFTVVFAAMICALLIASSAFAASHVQNKKVLVVVDMQVDFVDGSLGTKEAVAIVPNVVNKLKEIKAAGDWDIVFTRDTHHDDYLSTQEGKRLPVIHCIEGTRGWQIVDELTEFTKGVKIINKPTFGSYELAAYAAANGYKEMQVVGLCTDICVVSNALLLKAACSEAQMSVDASCCAGITPESHQAALTTMQLCQIDILNNK